MSEVGSPPPLTQIENRVQTITPGTARGRLIGGNLTVMTAILGSPYVPSLDGAILFLEDVGEDLYRVDRMFTQLALAGVLQKARAVIWGTCSECEPGEGFGSLTIGDILDDHVRLGRPVALKVAATSSARATASVVRHMSK